jgi:hypothetical protein
MFVVVKPRRAVGCGASVGASVTAGLADGLAEGAADGVADAAGDVLAAGGELAPADGDAAPLGEGLADGDGEALGRGVGLGSVGPGVNSALHAYAAWVVVENNTYRISRTPTPTSPTRSHEP